MLRLNRFFTGNKNKMITTNIFVDLITIHLVIKYFMLQSYTED